MSFTENLDIGRGQELCGKMDSMSTDMDINQLVGDCNSILLNATCESGNVIKIKNRKK